ncbi:MAG: hypothetical protein M1834_008270 [Cirrosporium novae-zelandiae]|nr:MAG: hypothetical protein M1834_008270 [Cirrosporium novae-zelandiae]
METSIRILRPFIRLQLAVPKGSTPRLFARNLHIRPSVLPLRACQPLLKPQSPVQVHTTRNNSTAPAQGLSNLNSQKSNKSPSRQEQEPAYELTFTCKPCGSRSSHRISKQGYHKGTVLITCPGCKNRHVISDNLKIFSDKSVTFEELMKTKGQLIKKGALDTESDLELWEDGTTTAHKAPGS